MQARSVLTGGTNPDVPASSVAPRRSALYVAYPPEVAGQIIELSPGLTIGRELPVAHARDASPDGSFAVLAHATVSRRHCAVQDAFGVPVLTDLGSSNGTKVDGVPLTAPRVLVPQNVVRLGGVLGVVDEKPLKGPRPTAALPGVAPAMVRARDALERAVTAAAPAVILGETGTGKERVAAEFHRRSERQGPYVKFSCAELARELVESQLFGHERGAFTGAATAHKGLFAAAHRGTLFLDEIGELHLDLQTKLLRVLQEGEVRPLGSLATQRVDVRVVAATNRDLAADVERGAFRRDLYARLSFFEVRLPPLRARRQDLFWWIDCLAANFAAAHDASPVSLRFQPDAAELLLLHQWPENLRGLDRFVHRVITSGETVVGRRVLSAVLPEIAQAPSVPPPAPAASPTEKPADDESSGQRTTDPVPAERPTREQFLAVYEATGRNVRATSKHFGKDRRQIYRWLELFGIER
jgi:DNA-binding NtrC family response regulator